MKGTVLALTVVFTCAGGWVPLVVLEADALHGTNAATAIVMSPGIDHEYILVDPCQPAPVTSTLAEP